MVCGEVVTETVPPSDLGGGTHAPQGTGEITEPTGQIETPPGQQLEVEENPEGQHQKLLNNHKLLRRDYKNVHKRLLWKNVSMLGTRSF